MKNNTITAADFAKNNTTDADWLAAMGNATITEWKRGDKVKCNGFSGSIVRHYHNGMFEVRLPGGVACVSFNDISPA